MSMDILFCFRQYTLLSEAGYGNVYIHPFFFFFTFDLIVFLTHHGASYKTNQIAWYQASHYTRHVRSTAAIECC